MRYSRLLMAAFVSAAVAVVATACSKSATSPSSSATCAVTLGAVTTDVAAAGTTGTIPVTTASTCAWTAASSATFLTISSGASGTGNGSVAYAIAANTGAARSASISVNGSAVNFTQGAGNLQAPGGCAVTLSATSVTINSGGGTATIGVTAASNCGWTAASNASFLTAQATASGNGDVVITATANAGAAARTGTVTIGGQTVTVTQDPGLFASFNMLNPAQTAGPTNVCQFRGAAGSQTTCTLQSTSFSSGANAITTYAWTLQYTYGTVKVTNSTSSASTLNFSDSCGVANGGATDEGALQPFDVTLTITDSNGNTATAKSGSGTQPALFVQLFNCGK
jgi:Putative binding domain, N-terminal